MGHCFSPRSLAGESIIALLIPPKAPAMPGPKPNLCRQYLTAFFGLFLQFHAKSRTKQTRMKRNQFEVACIGLTANRSESQIPFG
jgi:hypothetical protein